MMSALGDQLERQAVELEQHARDILERSGRTVDRLVRCDLQSEPGMILYVGLCGYARTAWVWSGDSGDQPVVRTEPGFVTEPKWRPGA